MPGADDLADSTDWLNTPLAGLMPLESGLRCQVCKDFFTTPMITSCSHTFCSLCIRRYLSQEGRCPACRESDQEMKLRRNWALEELVAHFTQIRGGILEFARRPLPQPNDLTSERPKKRRKLEPSKGAPERRSTRSQSKRLNNPASQPSQEGPPSTREEVADSEEEGSVYDPEAPDWPGDDSNKEPHDGLVACPCCQRRVKESLINTHLDRCIQGLPTSPSPPVLQAGVNGHPSAPTLAYAQRTKSPLGVAKQDRLPTINYSLYTETSLRKKLKELGIPSHGNKELMRKRHTEWMNLWNANCDSSLPKTKQALLRELDTWERTLGRQLERGVASATSGVMVKDFDRDGWVKSQKGEFDDLIKKARKQRKTADSVQEQRSRQEGADAIQGEGRNDHANVGVQRSSAEHLGDDHETPPGPKSIPDEPSMRGPVLTNGMREEDDPQVSAMDTQENFQGVHGAPVAGVSAPRTPPAGDQSQMDPPATQQSPSHQRSKFFA